MKEMEDMEEETMEERREERTKGGSKKDCNTVVAMSVRVAGRGR